jgi:hypothetical protein
MRRTEEEEVQNEKIIPYIPPRIESFRVVRTIVDKMAIKMKITTII